MDPQLVNFKMDRKEYARVREKVERDSVNMSAFLRRVLMDWVENPPPIRVKSYTFTPSQLYNLLTETIGLYVEHVEVHGESTDAAKHNAAIGTEQGLDAEQELFDLGELDSVTTQIYTSYAAERFDRTSPDYSDSKHYQGRTRLFKGDPPEAE